MPYCFSPVQDGVLEKDLPSLSLRMMNLTKLTNTASISSQPQTLTSFYVTADNDLLLQDTEHLLPVLPLADIKKFCTDCDLLSGWDSQQVLSAQMPQNLDALVWALMDLQKSQVRSIPQIITNREDLVSLMCLPYESEHDYSDPCPLLVQRVGGIVHIIRAGSFAVSLQTQNRPQQEQSVLRTRTDHECQALFLGHTFKLRALGVPDTPAIDAKGSTWNSDLNWNAVVETRIGNVRSLVGGVVYGYQLADGEASLTDEVTGQIKTHNFHQLATTLKPKTKGQVWRMPLKMMRYWAHATLFGIPRMTLALREAETQRIEEVNCIDIESIPQRYKRKWRKDVCLASLHASIDWILSLSKKRLTSESDLALIHLMPATGLRWEQCQIALPQETPDPEQPTTKGARRLRTGIERIGFLPADYVEWVRNRN